MVCCGRAKTGKSKSCDGYDGAVHGLNGAYAKQGSLMMGKRM